MSSDVVVPFAPPAGHPKAVTRLDLCHLPVPEHLGDGFTASIDLSSKADRESLVREAVEDAGQMSAIRYLEGQSCLELWLDGELVALAAISGTVSNDGGNGQANHKRVNALLALAGLFFSSDVDQDLIHRKVVQAIKHVLLEGTQALAGNPLPENLIAEFLIVVRVHSQTDEVLYDKFREVVRRYNATLRVRRMGDVGVAVLKRPLIKV